MRVFLRLCLLLAALLHLTRAQASCISNVTLLTESDLQKFEQCQTVNGDLVLGVRDCSRECTIASLTSLGSIRTVTGDFVIQCCNALSGIPLLPTLIEVKGQVRIFYNSKLLNIGGFSALAKVGNVVVSQNPALLSITGFGSLVQASGYVSIENNPLLTGITGFTSLVTISGEKLVNNHGLAILYNPVLTDISGFRSLNGISFGTVHIEGNKQLCYAGYPLWNYGSYSNRYSTGDKGIDWRSILSITWQFSWESFPTNGVPSLVIQDNGNETICASATCDDSCQTGAGCLGPNDPNLCGSCYITETINSCHTISRPGVEGSSCSSWWPPTKEPFTSLFAVAVSFGVGFIVLLLVVICLITFKIRASCSNDNKGKYWISPRLPDERAGYEPARASKPLYASTVRELNSSEKERTVIGRGAGSSTSSSLSGRGQFHRPQKTSSSRGGLGNESMSSMDSSARYARSNGGPLKSPKRDDSTTDHGNARVSISDRQNSNAHSLTTVVYTHNVPSPGHQYKDPLKSSERVLQSINEQQPLSQPPPPSADVSNGQRERVEDSPWEEVSDIGQGMQSHLREDSWSEEDNSFEDDFDQEEEEEVDGGDIMEFPSDKINLGKLIGKGSFGKVFKAEAHGLVDGEEVTKVVIKQSNSDASEEELEVFLQPAEAMKRLNHDNVLGLLGVSVDGPNVLIILEYCSNDNLKSYLKRQKPNSMRLKHEGTVHQIIVDIAEGLKYLHSMEIAHNDLAARNCLVAHDSRVKVGDYGYSRTAFRGDYYSRTPGQMAWPIRWMSPEILLDRGDGILDSHPPTELSNVWSYGVILWEVSTFGEYPYPKMTDEDVIELLKTTGRCNMKNPVPPSDPIHSFHSIMKRCWKAVEERASMEEIVKRVNAVKDEFRPVRYSGRPSRPAPKKPANAEADQRNQGSKGTVTQTVVGKGKGVKLETVTVSAEVEEIVADRPIEGQDKTVASASAVGKTKHYQKERKSDNIDEQEMNRKVGSVEKIVMQQDRPFEQKGRKKEEVVKHKKKDTKHSVSPTELMKDRQKEVDKSGESKKSTGVKPEVKPKPKFKRAIVNEGGRRQEEINENKLKSNDSEDKRKEKSPQEEEVDAVPITLPPARDSWGDLDADMFANEEPLVIPPVREEDYLTNEQSEREEDEEEEEEEVSFFREDPIGKTEEQINTDNATQESLEDRMTLEHDPLSHEERTRINPLANLTSEIEREELTVVRTDFSSEEKVQQEEGSSNDLSEYVQPQTMQKLEEGNEYDSWDEFEANKSAQVAPSDPSSGPERKESFQLPPESPEETPPLHRKPSYLTSFEEAEEEEEEDEEGGGDSPPPIPTSLPPEDEEEYNFNGGDEQGTYKLEDVSPPATNESEEKKPFVPPPDEFSQSELDEEPSTEKLEQQEQRQEGVNGKKESEDEDDVDDLIVEEPVKLDNLISRSDKSQQPVTSTVKPKKTAKQRKEREKKEKELEKKRKKEMKERERQEKKQKQKSKGKRQLDDASDAFNY